MQLMATTGFAVPEVESVYLRVRELCQQTRTIAHLPSALAGLFTFYFGRAEYGKALTIAKQIDQMARRRASCPAAHQSQCLRAYVVVYGEVRRVVDAPRTEQSALPPWGGVCLNGVGIRPPGAVLRIWRNAPMVTRTCRTSCECSPGASLVGQRAALSLWHYAWSTYAHVDSTMSSRIYRGERGRRGAARAGARARVRIMADHRGYFAWCGAGGTGADGARIGRDRQWHCCLPGDRSKNRSSLLLSPLAAAYATCGQTEKALASLADGLSVIDRGGERWWKAELLRLRGELLLQSQSRRSQHELQEQAEACFREAMITARRQGAKSLELRAVTSFSRLCREGRKRNRPFGCSARSTVRLMKGLRRLIL